MPITQQTIAIIGAGKGLGFTLAKGATAGNYRLLLFDKETKHLDSLKAAIYKEHPKAEVKVMNCAYECSWEADIIILDTPKADEVEIAEMIHDVATQKIVVTIADFNEQVNLNTADRLETMLPYTKIVKVFKHESKPRVIISGDDQDALHNISELLKTAGYKISTTLRPSKTSTY